MKQINIVSGGWLSSTWECHTGSRSFGDLSIKGRGLGFRLIKTLKLCNTLV